MLRIGLTGGISTGKSTVAQILREDFGVPVVDADAASREVVLPGQPALAEIAAYFGASIVSQDGQLNRKALGRIVMADPEKRKALEAITHPRILAHIVNQLLGHEQDGATVTVVEAALMVETGSYAAYDKVLVVTSTPEIQQSRLMKRNGFSSEEAQSWIANQLPLSEKEAIADAVIQNNGSHASLRASVHHAWAQIGFS
jgi:dephospho-CoA kinase